MVRPGQSPGKDGGCPGAGGGSAGAEGRCGRQHPRRARHRRQGRAGADPAVRHGGGGAGSRRRAGGQGVRQTLPGKPAAEPRADSPEQAPGDDRHHGPDRVQPGCRARPGAGCHGAQAALQGAGVLQPAEGPGTGPGQPHPRLPDARFGGSAGRLSGFGSARGAGGCRDGSRRARSVCRRAGTGHRAGLAVRGGTRGSGCPGRAAARLARGPDARESRARRQAGVSGTRPLGHRSRAASATT